MVLSLLTCGFSSYFRIQLQLQLHHLLRHPASFSFEPQLIAIAQISCHDDNIMIYDSLQFIPFQYSSTIATTRTANSIPLYSLDNQMTESHARTHAQSRTHNHSLTQSLTTVQQQLHIQPLRLPQIYQYINHLGERNVFGKARRLEGNLYPATSPSPPAGIKEDINDPIDIDRDGMSSFVVVLLLIVRGNVAWFPAPCIPGGQPPVQSCQCYYSVQKPNNAMP